ncbi:MAG: hypothetical protein OEW12_01080 [Deltaproteobacteria bacterium]|nr:hypothetical protein [Deltaproteobacteria bacterium]
MKQKNDEALFLQIQRSHIQRYVRLAQAESTEEINRLAMEWIDRFAQAARTRWSKSHRVRDSVRSF